MATREEKHSTRGRANVLRQMLAAHNPTAEINHRLVKEVLELCIECKGCKSECPANVDMARMKAEFMHRYYDRHGVPLRSKFIGRLDTLSRYAGVLPRFSNAVMGSAWFKRILGIHPRRRFPELARQTFRAWWKNRQSSCITHPQGDVVLVLDPFSEFYEPHIAIAAVSVLEDLNYRVTITPCLSLGRIQISQGLLRQAREKILKAINLLHPFAEKGIPLIGLEPSELLTLRDEAADLFVDKSIKQKVGRVSKQAFLIEEFIVRNRQAINLKVIANQQSPSHMMVHGHCHQESLVGMEPTVRMLSLIPDTNVEIIASGCCGMAGAFGYEREHYDISLKIAELVLFPAIRNAPEDSLIVATGTSCRHQILEGLGVRAYHPAEVLAMKTNLNYKPPVAVN